MRSRLLAAMLLAGVIAAGEVWQTAQPGYRYEFPRDYFSHPNYQTEWWYYTGNLRSADGHRYGFELTFFRRAVDVAPEVRASEAAAWVPDQLYLAHLALSDIDGKRFYYSERLNRAGPGLAGISLNDRMYWNGNWQVQWKSLETGEQQLRAVCSQFKLLLELKPEKRVVVNGRNGISRKGPAPDDASHYLSFTRIAARGRLTIAGQQIDVTGPAWMDHEFFSERSNSGLAGWDWFSIQLDNREELMLYRLRDAAGNPTPYSSGTYVDAQGRARFLDASEFSLAPGRTWHSRNSGANYPVSWTISVPALQLYLSEEPALEDQELFSKGGLWPTYWEGAVTYRGNMRARQVAGLGYLEMTGYAKRALRLGADHNGFR